jgi:hypothetical protein
MDPRRQVTNGTVHRYLPHFPQGYWTPYGVQYSPVQYWLQRRGGPQTDPRMILSELSCSRAQKNASRPYRKYNRLGI